MSQLINMTVPGEPKPWQVWVRMSAPTPGYLAFKAWQETIQAKCLEVWRNQPLIETAVEIHLEFVRSYPKNLPKKEASRERRLKEALVRKPDLDNLCKAAIDGIKGIILKDDTVVTRLSAEKRFGPEPMTMITVYKSESLEEAVPDPHLKEVRD
jgi:Holliday junction resolvase RusA-like endonuclease